MHMCMHALAFLHDSFVQKGEAAFNPIGTRNVLVFGKIHSLQLDYSWMATGWRRGAWAETGRLGEGEGENRESGRNRERVRGGEREGYVVCVCVCEGGREK